jgi:general secretion pathway protein K
MKDERGFALVLTLIVTALLVALAAEFVDEVFVDTSASHNFVNAQQASLLAGSGTTGGIKLLQFAQGMQDYSSLADLDRLAKLLSIGDEKGTLQVSIEEESGKLNINSIVDSFGKDNSTYRPIAERLFKKLGLQPEMLDAVADWISSNEVPRMAGAKTSYYQALKPPYEAKGRKLDTFEELRLVKGFDEKTLKLLRPYITVYSDVPNSPTSPININTAPKELIAVLDAAMTDSLAQQIVDERMVTPFKTPTDLENRVSGMTALSRTLASNSIIMQNQKGAVFRLISQAQVNETTRVIEAVVRVGGQPPILYWREF